MVIGYSVGKYLWEILIFRIINRSIKGYLMHLTVVYISALDELLAMIFNYLHAQWSFLLNMIINPYMDTSLKSSSSTLGVSGFVLDWSWGPQFLYADGVGFLGLTKKSRNYSMLLLFLIFNVIPLYFVILEYHITYLAAFIFPGGVLY